MTLAMSTDNFRIEERNGAQLLRLRGEVDFSQRAEFEDALAGSTADRPLVVSFAECTFCDSSIVGALMKLRNNRPNAEITLIISPESAVARVFDLVGIDRVFTVEPDESNETEQPAGTGAS